MTAEVGGLATGAAAGSPQHATVPETLTAQANWCEPMPPAGDSRTSLKVPDGGAPRAGAPGYPLPQQASVPSLRIPQPYPSPALICQKVPPGGEDCPKESLPRQTARPSVRMP